MGAGFRIEIGAKDSATPIVDRLNARIAKLRAPADQFAKQVQKFNQLTGLQSLQKGFAGVAAQVSALSAFTGLASVAGIARLVQGWADYSQTLTNASLQTGIAASKLYDLRNAGRLAGVSADAVSASYAGLGKSIYDAIGGRNNAALGMLTQLGIKFQDASHHALSTEKIMEQIADQVRARHGNPQAQQSILDQLGISRDMLPLLDQGADGIRRLQDEAKKYSNQTDADISRGNAMAKSLTRMEEAAEGFGNSIASAVGPTFSGYLDSWATKLGAVTAGIEASMKAYDDAMKESGDFQAFLKKREDALSPDKASQLDALRKKHGDNADHRDNTHTAFGQALEDTIPGLSTLDGWLSKLWGNPDQNNKVRGGHGGTGKYLYDHVAPLRGLDDFINGGAGKAAWDRGNGAPDPALSGRSLGQQLGDYGSVLPNAWRHVQDAWAAEKIGGAGLLGIGAEGRQSAAMRYFMGQGWTRVQAAGPAANIGAESGFNPFASGDHGHAYGLGQWQGPRQRDYAKLFGHTMQSVKDFTQAFSEQLEFYQHELTKGTDAGARRAGRLLGQSTSGYDSGSIVSMYDERPAARDEAARNRGNAAEMLAGGDGRDGKVTVDTRVRITSDGRVQTASSARGDGAARANAPKIESSMVFA